MNSCSCQFNNLLVPCPFLSTEVDCDPTRVWCPMPGCETIVQLGHSKHEGPQSATCQACTAVFCAKCSLPWHPATPCLPHPAETLVNPSCGTRSVSQSKLHLCIAFEVYVVLTYLSLRGIINNVTVQYWAFRAFILFLEDGYKKVHTG